MASRGKSSAVQRRRPKKKAAKKRSPAHTGKRKGARPPAKKKRARPAKKARPAKRAERLFAEVLAPRPGWVPALTRSVVGAVILFLALITTSTFVQEIGAVAGWQAWTAAPVYFFLLGVALMGIAQLGLPSGLLYLYVFGHELTHVIFVYLCGGKVQGDIRVSIRGGHVVANKSNWLITLSPYFVPFYTVLVASGFILASPLVDLAKPLSVGWFQFELLYLLYACIGFTWSHHIFYTLAMLRRDQPDLQINGIIVSFLIIYLVNSLIVVGFVTWASVSITWRGFLEAWFGNAHGLTNLFLVRVAGLIW